MNLDSVLIGSEDPARLVASSTKLLGEPQGDEGGSTGWMLGQLLPVDEPDGAAGVVTPRASAGVV